VPAGPILNVQEILSNEHVAARGMVDSFEHPLIGKFPYLRLPFQFKGFDNPTAERPPMLGEQTDTVLLERLGLSADRLAHLRRESVI
jgi:crotonobetainyl-CoA:carnitine CoA-transferase CaiB-like acyl-CoA transferase